MNERWAAITDYEEFYAISDHGNVWRNERTIYRIHTRPYVQAAGMMATRVGNDLGHLCVTLYDGQGKRHKHWVHRLVATEFIPNPRNLPFVLHGVAGPAVNHVSNLRWGNQSDNEKDKRRHMLARQTERENR
jgi:hypothetical protein